MSIGEEGKLRERERELTEFETTRTLRPSNLQYEESHIWLMEETRTCISCLLAPGLS